MDTLEEINVKGFADEYIDPTLDLFDEISRLKKEKNAVILAHYYQEGDIQDIADYIGDSLGLSQQAAKTDADIIVFAGVHFMAETAKILSPKKKVLLPDIKAGCSLADSCPPHLFRKFKEAYPDHLVITYVNCTAELKAMSDIVCTSSNAVGIVNSLSPEQKIIFGPDRNLGRYVAEKTGRDLVLWNGACMVHEIFSREKITRLKERYPEAKILAHPECEQAVLDLADYIGSTTGILRYATSSPDKQFIVATEAGILHQMEKDNPDKEFIPAPPNNNCACNDCPHMKRNTLEKLYLCLKNEIPEILVPEDIIARAVKPIERMLEISAELGL
ncbi:quinolinate synthase NadA [Mucilaginibacter ginkgonis]|uniref:Quinolinate synthase n=1 Tax=Mucilaginibacter ginkgonis TaxID=2682091 RepID=A0A6I4HXH1_9SPHI|nr:quinolinate synthase NadA [Mucilaginibacter ginkgonis]QQL49363.1 quinolinate synthase NadA [Mucilaginibacter ginkgonis]